MVPRIGIASRSKKPAMIYRIEIMVSIDTHIWNQYLISLRRTHSPIVINNVNGITSLTTSRSINAMLVMGFSFRSFTPSL